MKHKIVDDVNVKLNVDIPVEDLEDLIDSVVNAALTIIAASTVAYIFKQFCKGDL